jgi:hypothetical protein
MSEATPDSGRYPPKSRVRRAAPVAVTLVQSVSGTITIAGFPLSTWHFFHYQGQILRAPAAQPGDGSIGDPSGEPACRRHRLAYGHLRMWIWLFPGAKHEGVEAGK